MCTFGFAQTEKPRTVCVEKGTSSLAAYIAACKNGLVTTTNGIMYNYYVADGLAVRGALRIGYKNNKVDKEDTDYFNFSQFGLTAGIQKSLFTSRMWDGHIGAVALIETIGEHQHQGSVVTKNSVFQFGLRPYIGIDHYIVKNLFFGIEAGYDLTYANAKSAGAKTDQNFSVGFSDLSSVCAKLGFCF